MPHPGTAAPAPLVTAAVFPAAAGHFGPTPGTAGQDALLARVAFSASLFWVTHGVPAPRRGCSLAAGPLSQWAFTAAGPAATRLSLDAAGAHSAPSPSRL